MNKTSIFLDKFHGSKLEDKLKNTAPFIITLIEKYIKTVCEKFNVNNQFIQNLLETKFEFTKYENDTINSKSHLCENFNKNLELTEKTLHFYYFFDELLQNKLPSTSNQNEIDKFKILAYQQISELIHELNHATGLNRFCKLCDGKYIPLDKKETKLLLQTDFVYREKSGMAIERYSKSTSQKSIANDMLYEALTEVLAHNVLNSSNFDDIQYVNVNSKRKDSYSLPFSYEPFSTAIILFSYLDENVFSQYFDKSKVTKENDIWDDIFRLVRPLCFSFYDLKNLEQEDNVENLLNELVKNINELINYFYSSLLSKNLGDRNKSDIAFEIENSLTNKEFWKNCIDFIDEQAVSTALENLTSIEDIRSNSL